MDFNDSEVVDLLGRLSNAKSPSGFEDETIEVVRDFCQGWAKVETNSVHDALVTPKNFTGEKPVLMLDAHGDEVGGMVKSIRSNGTMTFVELGRFSPNVLTGQDVLVRNTLGEWVHGVIGVKPPHFMSAAERASGELQLILDVGRAFCPGHQVRVQREDWRCVGEGIRLPRRSHRRAPRPARAF